MQTTDKLIDEILLKSPYGAKAYASKQKRQRKKDKLECIDDVSMDHPEQSFINFEEDNYE